MSESRANICNTNIPIFEILRTLAPGNCTVSDELLTDSSNTPVPLPPNFTVHGRIQQVRHSSRDRQNHKRLAPNHDEGSSQLTCDPDGNTAVTIQGKVHFRNNDKNWDSYTLSIRFKRDFVFYNPMQNVFSDGTFHMTYQRITGRLSFYAESPLARDSGKHWIIDNAAATVDHLADTLNCSSSFFEASDLESAALAVFANTLRTNMVKAIRSIEENYHYNTESSEALATTDGG